MLQEAVAVAGDWLEAQKLDIRVGKVISAELHPDADRLGAGATAFKASVDSSIFFWLQLVCGAGRCW